MSDTKFGVCTCDISAYEPEISELTEYNSYDEAFAAYLDLFKAKYEADGMFPIDLWFVFIEDNKVVQFEQLERKVKTKNVDIKEK